ncbi:hypothetical protein [Wolbachia endosymbiont (group A) of Nomada goodeniana]|uniref:hypothetical protein n=1 Tax=Wolbachia endosymbiont (group A) of Nomada goodeniana TaxID=3066207 RepID=UPI00333FA4C1
MTGPQVKSSKPPKLPTQVTNEDEKIFEKEEHQVIHGAPRSAWRTVGENPTQTKSSQQFGTDHYVA